MKKILLFSTCLMCLLMDAQDYTQERREVKDGKRTEAKASWWGFDKNNATKCLQDAINSGVKRLIVDNTGRDWILDRIVLASNQEIILEKNVRLVARKGGFQKVRGDSSFINFGGGHHIILRGEPGAVIIMHKKDYQNRTLYKPSDGVICLTSAEAVISRSGISGWNPRRRRHLHRQRKPAFQTCQKLFRHSY